MTFPSLKLTEVIVRALPRGAPRLDVTPVEAPEGPRGLVSLPRAQRGIRLRWERLLSEIAHYCRDHDLPRWVIAGPGRLDQHTGESLMATLGYAPNATPQWHRQFIQELRERLQEDPSVWAWGQLRLDDGHILLEPLVYGTAPAETAELEEPMA